MKVPVMNDKTPLIIYTDDDGTIRKTYSKYIIDDGIICFNTQQNTITIPLSRLIKIKEEVIDLTQDQIHMQ